VACGRFANSWSPNRATGNTTTSISSWNTSAAGDGIAAGHEKLEDAVDCVQAYDDVPLRARAGFMLSELKTSFLIGFQIYLPFLVLDMVVSSVMISMGMFMLPPVLISLPFKLLLFVLVDGWRLIVGMLLESFQPYT
jgi:flagellar biosynthesis protein FliP